MKVIFGIINMTGGGSERVISILANNFVKQGIDTTIMMIAGSEVVYELDERIKIVSMGTPSGGNISIRLRRIRNMRRLFKKERGAIVIAFGPEVAVFCALAAVFMRNRLIAAERNLPTTCAYPRMRNLAYQKASAIVFQTKGMAEYFPPYLRKKGVVIGNPLTDNLPERATCENRPKQEIVAVGRLEQQKNYPLLLEAFKLFCDNKGKDYLLKIYGTGNLIDELKEKARFLSIEDNVEFVGYVTDLTQKIKDSAMYILSSDYEGMPNALMEAMAVGLPVIATDCPSGGPGSLIQNGINGILVPCGDSTALSQAMLTLADNQPLAEELGKNATEIKRLYNIDTVCANWIKILNK